MSSAAGPYRQPPPELSAGRLVPAPTHARRVAFGLAVAFVGFGVFALLTPWQQSVRGAGRAIAFAPLERQQNVEAPISGRVVRWYVQEGSVVEEGDRIVEIADNDPRWMERLEIQRGATRDRLTAYEANVEAARRRRDAVRRGQNEAIRGAEARVRVAERAVESADQSEQAAEAALETALLNLARQRALHEQGLASRRELELAELAERRARTDRDAARARLGGARSDLAGKQAELARSRADADSNEQSALSSLQSAESDAAGARAALARMDAQIARQEQQLVTAPRDGTIFRVVANQGGEQVSAGDTLAVLVPSTQDRAVEMWVDGNDAALIEPGRPVRLQFEGWPAVQFTGWPSVAVGTFGGRVAFVDSTDDGNGSFRVVVTPDPNDEPWPGTRFLRQGVRANGWVLLRRVTVGFELWRQLNGFPPALTRPPGASSGSSGSTYRSSSYGGGSDYGGGDAYGGDEAGGSYGGGGGY